MKIYLMFIIASIEYLFSSLICSILMKIISINTIIGICVFILIFPLVLLQLIFVMEKTWEYLFND
jgi:hypothetical protein